MAYLPLPLLLLVLISSATSQESSCASLFPSPLAILSLFVSVDPNAERDQHPQGLLHVSGYNGEVASLLPGSFRVDVFDSDTYLAVAGRIKAMAWDLGLEHSQDGRFLDREIRTDTPRLHSMLQSLPVDYCKITRDTGVDRMQRGGSTLPTPLEPLHDLYEKYKGELAVLRERARRLRPLVVDPNSAVLANNALNADGSANPVRPLQDGFMDIEAEITYMRIRELRPKQVLELSPNCGWSSFYLLSALAINTHVHGDAGHLHSFDLHDCSVKIIREHLPDLYQLWSFHQGDAFEGWFADPSIADSFDYFFIDSEHTYEFATMIIDALFRARTRKDLMGSIHDVYNLSPKPEEEGQAFLEYFGALETVGPRELFSPSAFKDINFYSTLMRMRSDVGVAFDVNDHVSPCKWFICANGALFFNFTKA
jgi:hypothetical protein